MAGAICGSSSIFAEGVFPLKRAPFGTLNQLGIQCSSDDNGGSSGAAIQYSYSFKIYSMFYDII